MNSPQRSLLGAAGEALCDVWLDNCGCALVARNVRLFGTEFDRLYRRDNELWFVEVKSVRDSHSGKAEPGCRLTWARQRLVLWMKSAQLSRQQRAIRAWQLGAHAHKPQQQGKGGPWLLSHRTCTVKHILVLVVCDVCAPLVPEGNSSYVHLLEAFEIPSGRLLARSRLPSAACPSAHDRA